MNLKSKIQSIILEFVNVSFNTHKQAIGIQMINPHLEILLENKEKHEKTYLVYFWGHMVPTRQVVSLCLGPYGPL